MPRGMRFVNLRPLNELEKLIADRISKEGPLSFAAFMDMALYQPGLGYYCSAKEKLGFRGDFFTSCTHSPMFRYAFAKQLHRQWKLSETSVLTVVTYGAGTGDLCAAIMHYVGEHKGQRGKFSYYIIEISPSLRETQRSRLPTDVQWIDDIGAVSGFSGVVLSNELL